MKEKIKLSVKTNFSKYGLKDESREKISNLVEARLQARGEIQAEALDAIIEEEVKACEPFVALIQSEADSRVSRNTPPTPAPNPNTDPQPTPAPFDMEKFMTSMADVMNKKVAEAVTPFQEKLALMEQEKTRSTMLSSVKASFEEKYKSVKFSPMQKGFLEDAWDLATNGVNDKTTAEELLKNYEDRFNKSCTLAGQVVVIPTEGGNGGNQGKSEFEQRVDKLNANDDSATSVKSALGLNS